MEQRARDLDDPSKTDEHDSLPIPVQPLQSTSFKDHRKRIHTHSSDSGVNSQLVFSQPPALSPATPNETSIRQPSTSQHAQIAPPSSKEPFSSIQQFIRKTAKLRSREPKYNRSEPNRPDPQSVLRTRTR